MKRKRECVYAYELDLLTLVCTRGPNFPVDRLASRLICPRCGSRAIRVVVTVPGGGTVQVAAS